MLEHFRTKYILACSYKFVGQKDFNNVKKAIIGCYFKKKCSVQNILCRKQSRKDFQFGVLVVNYSDSEEMQIFQIHKFLI